MTHRWQQIRTTSAATLLVTLALIAAACDGTATKGTSPPGGTEPTLQPTDTTGAIGYEGGYEVGQLAPDFVLTSDEGQRLTLASLRTEDRPVVLYFFTTR